MVVGAENIALALGMSEGVVGLTILALGTSLPELGTVAASARRGRNDLVLGNVLGSNMPDLRRHLGVDGHPSPNITWGDKRFQTGVTDEEYVGSLRCGLQRRHHSGGSRGKGVL